MIITRVTARCVQRDGAVHRERAARWRTAESRVIRRLPVGLTEQHERVAVVDRLALASGSSAYTVSEPVLFWMLMATVAAVCAAA